MPLPVNRSSICGGIRNRGGIWAPCLSSCDGLFYLIYTDVKEWEGTPDNVGGGFKDTHNYLITAADVRGPWSEPIYLNSSGFDPSLFHDDNGKKWLVNVIWDYRPGKNSFAGILLQEYDPAKKMLIGKSAHIFSGTPRGVTEAPHLYTRNNWYYLMTAEGGTSYTHAVTLARSRNIDGPYELHPKTHLLTAVADLPGFQKAHELHDPLKARACLFPGLQKAGHASMVPWKDNEWILAHLCGRPLWDTWRCPLGRETALQKIIWSTDDWPYLEGDGAATEVSFSSSGLRAPDSLHDPDSLRAPNNEDDSADNSAGESERDEKTEELWMEDFDGPGWNLKLNTLRGPADDEYFSLSERSGWLRLYGAESMLSRFRQSVLLRRVQHFYWSAETCVDFSPESFQHMAGLIIRYDESTQLLFRISDIDGTRRLGVISFDLRKLSMPLGENEILLANGPVELGVDSAMGELRLRWRQKNSRKNEQKNRAEKQPEK